MSRMKIGELCMQANLIDEMQVNAALAHQRQWGGLIGQILIDKGMIDEIPLHMGLAKQFGIQLVCVPDLKITSEIINALPVSLCSEKSIFPIGFQERTLLVATAYPQDVEARDQVAFKTGYNVRLFIAPLREIEWAIRHYHQGDPAPCPPPKTRVMVDENEFKITDAAGNTVMKSMDQLRAEHEAKAKANAAAQAPAADPSPVAASSLPPPPGSLQQTADMGDLQDKVARLQVTLKKQRQLLRAMTELMLSKGAFTREELRAFMDKFQ